MSLTRLCLLACLLPSALIQAQLVTKVIEPSDDLRPWKPDIYSKTDGTISQVQSDATHSGSPTAMELKVNFPAAGGHKWWAARYGNGFLIPGEARTVSFWAKTDNTAYTTAISFHNAWGEAQGIKFNLAANDTWQKVTLTIPGSWKQPISLTGFTIDNWERRNAPSPHTLTVVVDEVTISTDVSKVDPSTGRLAGFQPPTEPKKGWKEPAAKLVDIQISTPEVSNVFSGTKPTVLVSVRSWQSGDLPVDVAYSVKDSSGKAIESSRRTATVESQTVIEIQPKIKRYDLYTIDVEAKAGGDTSKSSMRLAHLPKRHKLSPQQVDRSPYGLNVHSFRNRLVTPFTKAGLDWFRDYAFIFPSVIKAKDANGEYTGWPYYHQVIEHYESEGARLMPCLQKSMSAITMEQAESGNIPPVKREWIEQMTHIIKSFPTITVWELTNEFDLNAEKALPEIACDWRNYGNYHDAFARIVQSVGGDRLKSVENGRAGIFPERVRELVERGDFAELDVVNVHHYTGTEPPEINYLNRNQYTEDHHRYKEARLFYDDLRLVKRAASADGKQREAYLTEFGWDTKAGPFVSLEEQAMYLPRAYMMAIAAGIDKSFWFFDQDAEKDDTFFDGCGLLDHELQPKLSLCSLAGLTYALPDPKFVGTINAGEDTWGYVFDRGGLTVASLFSIEGKVTPELSFDAQGILDYLGNPLPSKTTKLSKAPIYIFGIKPDSQWYKQTAYSLYTPYLVTVPTGETFTFELEVRNNRKSGIQSEVTIDLPTGFTAEPASFSVEVGPGQQQRFPVQVTLPGDGLEGKSRLAIHVREPGMEKTIPLDVVSAHPFAVRVNAISGRPGQTNLDIDITSKRQIPHDAKVELSLPASWSAEPASQDLSQLKFNTKQTASFSLNWNPDWSEGERARAIFTATDGTRMERDIIPNTYKVPAAGSIKIDGDLSDWPAGSKWPDWHQTSTTGQRDVDFYAAWATDGLYVAADVQQSRVHVKDPARFWNGDVVEFWIDTADDKGHRFYERGDHQFWLVAQPDQQRAYLGRWKSKNELEKTLYDIPGAKTRAVKTANGYRIECFIPAKLMDNYSPQAGGKLGFCWVATVQNEDKIIREVSWPRKKDWGMLNLPKTWGTLILE